MHLWINHKTLQNLKFDWGGVKNFHLLFNLLLFQFVTRLYPQGWFKNAGILLI